MSKYRDQGTGELVPGRGFTIAKILLERRGIPTAIDFGDGSTITTRSASYGRDIGEEWEHLYLEVAGETLFASTSEVARLRDPGTGAYLFQSSSAN
jgi:hypothetical protein